MHFFLKSHIRRLKSTVIVSHVHYTIVSKLAKVLGARYARVQFWPKSNVHYRRKKTSQFLARIRVHYARYFVNVALLYKLWVWLGHVHGIC